MYIWSLLLTFLFLVTACSPRPLPKTTKPPAKVRRHAKAIRHWDACRLDFAKTLHRAKKNGETPDQLATLNFEYARALGATCYFTKAEKYYKTALELDRKTNGPIQMSLLELARLNLHRKRFAKANRYYQQLIPIYLRLDAAQTAPHSTAEVYTEYAHSLEQAGETTAAKKYRQKASLMEADARENKPIIEKTPYGKYCIE